MFEKPIVMIDFETTGMSPDQGDRVTEVAAVVRRRYQLIAPKKLAALVSKTDLKPQVRHDLRPGLSAERLPVLDDLPRQGADRLAP